MDPNGRIATTVTRAWTEGIGPNANFRPDCDLVSGVAQDNRKSGGDFCGAINDLNFGKPVFSNTIDPAILAGWSIRPNDWGVGVSVQQELVSRVSVEIGYFRRWFGNFIATTIARWQCRISHSSASPPRPIHACRAAATTSCRISTTAAVLTYNQTFNPAASSGPGAWLQPLSVLTPRFVKIGAQIDF